MDAASANASPPCSPRRRVLAALAAFGKLVRPRDVGEVRRDSSVVYAVFNGRDVLQVGKGSGNRFRSCMRGGLAARHNKAFICAMGEAALGRRNRYACVNVPASDLRRVERSVHDALGVGGGMATVIEGLELGSIRMAHERLWDRMKHAAAYSTLGMVEREMADELFELVTYATVHVRRARKTTPSVEGDILEGNTLAAIDKAYLIPILEKLTGGYLRYESHRPTAEAFEKRKGTYSYTPKREPFEVFGASPSGRAAESGE
jgi:hypothetical protein